MADQTNDPQAALQVPQETRARFSELVELISSSESMNTNERQYWINIMPIMTAEQIQNLHDILQNERRQLAAIDAKYSKDINEVGQKAGQEYQQHQRQNKREELMSAEHQHDAAELELEQDILNKINSQ